MEETEKPIVSKVDVYVKMVKEATIFYTTAFFVLLLIFSCVSFCFLVPFVIDPAISTLQHGFLPANCSTVRGEYREGKNNCIWSSCREGCTKEVYTCWQIEVIYTPTTTPGLSQEARLYPNVKGCGYPPQLECSRFFKQFSSPGQRFKCWRSSADPSLVISGLDLERMETELLYSIVIPAGLFLLSCCFLTIIFIQRRQEEEVFDSVVLTSSELVPDTTSQTSTITMDVIHTKSKSGLLRIEEDRKTFRNE